MTDERYPQHSSNPDSSLEELLAREGLAPVNGLLGEPLGGLSEQIRDDSPEEPVFNASELLPDNIRDELQAQLDEEERALLRFRFGLDRGTPRTLDEAAAHFGVTREEIRQKEARAMRKVGYYKQ